jgi:hypothetical protein
MKIILNIKDVITSIVHVIGFSSNANPLKLTI